MCVCVAKPVAVELRCHATALICIILKNFCRNLSDFLSFTQKILLTLSLIRTCNSFSRFKALLLVHCYMNVIFF